MPQDKGLRFMLAGQQIADNQIAEAKRTLRPLAFDPHVPPDNFAATLLAMLEKGDRAGAQAKLTGLSEGGGD